MAGVPTLEKTWVDPPYYAEVAVEATSVLQLASTFIAVKDGLKVGWAVKGSSDSVSFNMTGTDLLTDKTKIVPSSSGNRSWIVFRNPIDGMELCCSFQGATANLMTVAFSVSAGFTGGALNARPTATDEEVVISAAEWAFGSGNLGRMHVHVLRSEDGLHTYVFVMYRSLIMSVWFLGSISDVAASPGFTPKICYVDGNGTLTSATVQAYTRTFQTARIIAHSASAGTVAMQTTFRGATAAELVNTMAFRESNTGKWQAWSMGLVCKVSGKKGRHGRLTDIWRVPAGVPSGWIYRADDGSIALINLGGFLVPYGTDTPPRTV